MNHGHEPRLVKTPLLSLKTEDAFATKENICAVRSSGCHTVGASGGRERTEKFENWRQSFDFSRGCSFKFGGGDQMGCSLSNSPAQPYFARPPDVYVAAPNELLRFGDSESSLVYLRNCLQAAKVGKCPSDGVRHRVSVKVLLSTASRTASRDAQSSSAFRDSNQVAVQVVRLLRPDIP